MASSALRALRRRGSFFVPRVGVLGGRASPELLASVADGSRPGEPEIGVRHAFALAGRGSPLTIKGTAGRPTVTGIVATVFGSTGFLGRYVVNQLARVGAQVIVPYRGLEDVPRHLKPMGDLGQIVIMECNMRDEDAVKTAISKSNVVINLIGKEYETRNYSFEEVNIDIAERIARLSAEHGGIARFVHTSCLGANEQSASKQHRTKALGEEAVSAAFPGATILRPATMFGLYDTFLNRYAFLAKRLPNLPIVYEGKTRLQPVHAIDVASAVTAVVRDTDGLSVGKTYELGGPDVYTLREVLLLMFEILREDPRLRNVPAPVAWAIANVREFFFKRIPVPLPTLYPFYNHYLDSLLVDQVVSPDALGFESLGIQPRPMSGIAVEYLFSFRVQGPHVGAKRI